MAAKSSLFWEAKRHFFSTFFYHNHFSLLLLGKKGREKQKRKKQKWIKKEYKASEQNKTKNIVSFDKIQLNHKNICLKIYNSFILCKYYWKKKENEKQTIMTHCKIR